jgi:pimeloyl-ACP methyl ester carboxylesterase
MSTLKVPGAQLSYEIEGSGPLLILIPGASGVGEVFRQIARELIAQYQVVTYDRRGFSRSQLGFLSSPALFAKELMNALKDDLSLPRKRGEE